MQGDKISKLIQLKELYDKGLISGEEFASEKEKILESDELDGELNNEMLITPEQKTKKQKPVLLFGVIGLCVVAIIAAILIIMSNRKNNLHDVNYWDSTTEEYDRDIRRIKDPIDAASCIFRIFNEILRSQYYRGLDDLFADKVKHYNESWTRYQVVPYWESMNNYTHQEDDCDIHRLSRTRAKVLFSFDATNTKNEIWHHSFYMVIGKQKGRWWIIEEGEEKNATLVSKTDYTNLIQEFYEKVLDIKNRNKDITDYISPTLAKRIWTEDYDGCYQIWVFRTGFQDGYDEPSKILSITPTQNGWYEVKYTDMGILGKTLVHVANGKIDDYVAFDKAFQY